MSANAEDSAVLPSGRLLIIGGNEDKSGECKVLRKFVEMAGGKDGRIVVITTATGLPQAVGAEYKDLFESLGAGEVNTLAIANRQAANQSRQAEILKEACGIFFTGGDQLRLTSILGGSAVDAAIRAAFQEGAIIAGTSAGAAVMSETMIIGGISNDTPTKSSISMAHGMGFVSEVVIDQHFAQRGRISRLLAAVAQNPHIMGVGIDEDTALLVGGNRRCEVLGTQTVTILDGKNIVHSNVSDSAMSEPLAITNVLLHILPAGFGFDLNNRQPIELEAH